jgi:hypothetical protein
MDSPPCFARVLLTFLAASRPIPISLALLPGWMPNRSRAIPAQTRPTLTGPA